MNIPPPTMGCLSSSPFFNCEIPHAPRGFQLWFGLTSLVEVMGPPEWSLLASTVEVCGEEKIPETGDVKFIGDVKSGIQLKSKCNVLMCFL